MIDHIIYVSGGSESAHHPPIGTVLTVMKGQAEEVCKKNPGYLPCDGRALKIYDYPALYLVMGNVYNIGNEKKLEFRLPNTTEPVQQKAIIPNRCTCDFKGPNCWLGLGCRCGYEEIK